MKKFSLKLLIIAIALFVVDWVTGSVLERMYFNQTKSDYGFTTKALDIQTSDVVILGSSRAQHHYNPSIISDSFGSLTVYNAGRNGHFLVYQTAVLKMMLDRYTPNVVILDLTPYDLTDNNGDTDYDKLSSLLPYSNHMSYNEILRMRSWYEPIKAISKTYRYNSTFFKLLHPGSSDYQDNGYEPLYGSLQGANKLKETINDTYPLSDKKIRELKRMIELCDDNKIKFVVLTSPYYANYPETPTMKYVAALAKEKGFVYHSWMNTKQYDNPELYHTPDHLNAEGADIFSREVVSYLMSKLNCK